MRGEYRELKIYFLFPGNIPRKHSCGNPRFLMCWHPTDYCLYWNKTNTKVRPRIASSLLYSSVTVSIFKMQSLLTTTRHPKMGAYSSALWKNIFSMNEFKVCKRKRCSRFFSGFNPTCRRPPQIRGQSSIQQLNPELPGKTSYKPRQQ